VTEMKTGQPRCCLGASNRKRKVEICIFGQWLVFKSAKLFKCIEFTSSVLFNIESEFKIY